MKKPPCKRHADQQKFNVFDLFYLLDEVDQLRHVVPLFLVSCLLQVVLSLPKIDLQWLLIVVEAPRLVEKLDTFLRLFDILIENVPDLV